MSGIVGVISRRPAHENENDLEAIIASMKHEPSLAVSRYSDHDGFHAASLAYEASRSARMPLTSEQGDVALLLAGEHFGDESSSESLLEELRRGQFVDARPLAWTLAMKTTNTELEEERSASQAPTSALG